MLSISRLSSSTGLGSDWLGEALLNLSFLRAGVMRRGSVDQLTDHLRRDVGLPPRQEGSIDPRDLRW
jgi:hypothetical protein